jgi:TolB protein
VELIGLVNKAKDWNFNIMNLGDSCQLKLLATKPRKSTIFLALVLVLLSWSFFPLNADAKIYLDIYGPSLAKFPISIPPFRPLSGTVQSNSLSEKLSKVLSNDLILSGFFEIIPYTDFMGDLAADGMTIKTIDRRGWDLVGVDLVVKGGYQLKNGLLQVDARLLDIHQGKRVPIDTQEGPANQYGRLIHRISNEIMGYYTGQEGFFDTQIGFVSNSSGFKELYTMDADGGNGTQRTRLKSIILSPVWSPKGDEIAFVAYGKSRPVLYALSLTSGNGRVISQRENFNGPACWDPSGKKLALTLTIHGNPEIYIVDREGSILKRLTNNIGIDISPTWSPDGSHIAFVSDRSKEPQIYVADLVSGQIRRLTYEGVYNTSPAWSPRGDRIAYCSSVKGHHRVFIIRPDGNDMQQLTQGPGDDESPTWSPDGRYIAFSSTRSGLSRIYIMMANGQNQHKISDGKGEHILPNWSPKFKGK